MHNKGFNRASPGLVGAVLAMAGLLLVGGCSVELVGTGIAGDRQGTVRASNIEATVDADGRCEADLSLDPAALRSTARIGDTECRLVAARGRPSETIIRYEGDTRLATLRYETPKGAESYQFRDNRLAKITR